MPSAMDGDRGLCLRWSLFGSADTLHLDTFTQLEHPEVCYVVIADERDTVEDLLTGMIALHGDRDNPHTLWVSTRAAVASLRNSTDLQCVGEGHPRASKTARGSR